MGAGALRAGVRSPRASVGGPRTGTGARHSDGPPPAGRAGRGPSVSSGSFTGEGFPQSRQVTHLRDVM